MALEITNNTQRALDNLSVEPIIALKIDGIDTILSSSAVKEYIRIGDNNLDIDGSWYIGGFRELEGNKAYIDSNSTTYTIRQQINYDEGEGSSVPNMTIGFVDKDEFITRLISPGSLLEDILGRKCQVFVGFGTTSFAEDYIEVFKGFINKVQAFPGKVVFSINHPETKKKVSLFKKFSGQLTAQIQPTELSATLNTTTGLLSQVPGILGTYLKIDDEIMKYTITSPTTVSLDRAELLTTAAIHNAGVAVESFYTLEGNPLDIALYFMLSGYGTSATYEDLNVQSFVKYGTGNQQLANAIYFEGINIIRDYGVRAGDTVTVTGASETANNFTDRLVLEVDKKDTGYYLVVDGAPLVFENDSPAVLSFKSQYDILPEGMKMKPDEVDIDQHIFIRDFFHPSTQMRFYFTEDIDNGKEFLDDQIYKPIACYALPRKAKASVGYSVGPIPGATIKSLNITNTRNPSQIYIERTVSRAFFNEVVFKYDQYALDDSKFLRGYLLVSEDSKSRIAGGNRTYKVESKGLRTDLNAQNIVESQALRIIDRYKYAAESIVVSALFKDAVDIEIGDVVVYEGKDLKTSDITVASRSFSPRLFEVRNKEMNIKTGQVDFELLDTGQNINTRYGLMSPVSKIAGVVNSQTFVITFMDGYPSAFGEDEWRCWQGMFDLQDKIRAKIRDANYTFEESVLVTNISTNTFTLDQAPVNVLVPGLILEIDDYDEATEKQKLLYAFYQDNPTFADGEPYYSMI